METEGTTVEYEGLTVHSAIFREVNRPGRFIVRFIEYFDEPIQGLSIEIDPGMLLISGTESPQMILRLDTSPEVVEVHYRPSGPGCKIWLHNSWINEDGGVDAWLQHAGMLVEESENKVILRCSDGTMAPTFDDMVVEIEFLDD